MSAFKLTLQPQAVIIGSSEINIRHSFVIVNNQHYEVETPLKAIDIAFKCIHSLHAEYSKECEQLNFFLQTCIYGIHTKYDKQFSAVSTLIKEYEKFPSESSVFHYLSYFSFLRYYCNILKVKSFNIWF